MKKIALILSMFMLLAAAAGAVPYDDKDFRAGLKSYNSKNYRDAVRKFKEYIDKKPDPTAYYLAGYSLYKLGKYTEADAYFRDAYLIDPEFSLEKAGLIKKTSGEVVLKSAEAAKKPEPAETKKPEPTKSTTAATKETSAAKHAQTAAADKKAAVQTKTVSPAQEKNAPQSKTSAVPPAPAKQQTPASQPSSQPPVPSVPTTPVAPEPSTAAPSAPAPAFPTVPGPKTPMPAAGPAALFAIIAAMGMILVVIAVAFYIYFCLCMFLIAKKLNVPAPWTAWVPIVQIWTFVVAAGKPAWWIILLLVPVVNIFVNIYLWICITENLGKNKWLGLLILVPLAGFIYPGWLAFSKSEPAGSYIPPEEPLSE